ncbi:MAG TPA: 6-phosphogluconolactonase [Candidatus Acidoferrum sp.]
MTLADAAAVARRAAREFVRIASIAMKDKGELTVALSGGSTPKALYHLLVSDPEFRDQLRWARMKFFFGDERNVGPDDDESNFRMASEALLSKVSLQTEQVHRIKGEYQDAEKAALEYELEIRGAFRLKAGEFPRFDLILLGMGSEGHTASLFPGTKVLQEKSRIVARTWVGKLFAERVTLTAPAINAAANVMFMITGADKALVLKGVLEGPQEPEQLPAQMIQPTNGNFLWLIDADAGAKLSVGIRE